MPANTTKRTNDDPVRARRPITRHLPTAARILMGLIFVVMGLNGFFNFIPQPSTPMPQRAIAFLGALYATGYMIQLVSGTQVVVGVLHVINRFVPLALAVIAPIIVNIAAVHIFLAPAMAGPAAVVLTLELYLAWAYRRSYRPMLAMRAAAASQEPHPKGASSVAFGREQRDQDSAFQLDDWFDASGVASGANS